MQVGSALPKMFTIYWTEGYSTRVLRVNRRYLGKLARGSDKSLYISVYIRDCGAGVAELADAQDLGSCGLKTVEVQVLSPAPV